MAYTKVARTKESFKDKIQSLNESTKDSIGYLIANFENFSMEKYGTADLIPDLKKADETAKKGIMCVTDDSYTERQTTQGNRKKDCSKSKEGDFRDTEEG